MWYFQKELSIKVKISQCKFTAVQNFILKEKISLQSVSCKLNPWLSIAEQSKVQYILNVKLN